MILHVVFDNIYLRKFIEMINRNLGKERHAFVVLSYDPIRHLDNREHDNVHFMRAHRRFSLLRGEDAKKFSSLIRDSDRAVIHHLSDAAIRLLHGTKIEKNWVLWGSDLYDYIPIPLFQSRTRDLLASSAEGGLVNRAKQGRRALVALWRNRRRKAFVREIDNVMTCIEGDYRLVVEHFRTKARRVHFSYPIPVDFDDLNATDRPAIPKKYDFKSKYEYVIQLGNSGYPSNNHVEVLHRLRNIESGNFCVVAILSYGDNPAYIRGVIEQGRALLGERFIPITEYLEPEAYAGILRQIDVAIMNHNRQQGMGNIVSLLYMGKKVFLSEGVTTFGYLTEAGIAVYPVQSIDRSELKQLASLSEEKKAANRLRIYEMFKDDQALANIRAAFE